MPSPSPSVSGSNQRPPRPVSLTVPSLLGKDSSSLSRGSAGSLVEAVSACVQVGEGYTLIVSLHSAGAEAILGCEDLLPFICLMSMIPNLGVETTAVSHRIHLRGSQYVLLNKFEFLSKLLLFL